LADFFGAVIVGIDFTKSNMEQGRRSFGGQSLHQISIHDRAKKNPYELVIELIGKTLSSFDDDNLIPCFGFGDLTTRGTKVFPFGTSPCYGFGSVLERYREIAGTVVLSGPTNFAPVIRAAMEIVKETREYHVLLIVCDGQVTSERETAEAIVEASHYPMDIVVIGVGDGPWEGMIEFDDNLPERKIDNLQFVDSSKFLKYGEPLTAEIEARFATAALQELPHHYALCRKHKML
jgi:E3 ubiquitin-protein ligase RGLG